MSTLYRHEGSPEQRDDLLRALGRFVVRFSWLIHTLETATAGALQWTQRQDVIDAFNAAAGGGTNLQLVSDTTDPGRAAIWRQAIGVLSRKRAEHIINIYFAVCRVYGNLAWNDEDKRLAEAVQKELLEINARRNRLMHDSWSVLGENAVRISDRSEVSITASRTRTRSSGAQVEPVIAGALDQDSDYMKSLTDVAGAIQLVQWQVESPQGSDPSPPYSSLFTLDSDGHVVRKQG
jgi:hypothetical protein